MKERWAASTGRGNELALCGMWSIWPGWRFNPNRPNRLGETIMSAKEPEGPFLGRRLVFMARSRLLWFAICHVCELAPQPLQPRQKEEGCSNSRRNGIRLSGWGWSCRSPPPINWINGGEDRKLETSGWFVSFRCGAESGFILLLGADKRAVQALCGTTGLTCTKPPLSAGRTRGERGGWKMKDKHPDKGTLSQMVWSTRKKAAHELQRLPQLHPLK